ncbi:MAG: hypothetical protein JST16_18155 [Bdellovibrionales bacterium]|nr:hypothetical protein [Bdellovibrionales bacterium]
MPKNIDNGQTRREDINLTFRDQLSTVSPNLPIGLGVLGTVRGCNEDNVNILAEPSTDSQQRKRLPALLAAQKTFGGSPIGLALQKSVQVLTGKRVPLVLDNADYEHHPERMPRAANDSWQPSASAPTVVLLSDLADTCQANICKFVQSLVDGHIDVRIKVVAADMATKYREKAMLGCAAQFGAVFAYEEVNGKVSMRDTLAKVLNGEELSGKALRLPPVTEIQGNVKSEVSGLILPAAKPAPAAPVEELGGDRAVALPLLPEGAAAHH